MTSPCQSIQIKCPRCGSIFEAWWRPSINLRLDDFDDEYLEAATTSTCPKCQCKVRHDVLVVRENRIWELASA